MFKCKKHEAIATDRMAISNRNYYKPILDEYFRISQSFQAAEKAKSSLNSMKCYFGRPSDQSKTDNAAGIFCNLD
jgi:hypothetical protein